MATTGSWRSSCLLYTSSGRDELPIPQKARLDGEYVKLCSLREDLSILLKTAVGVVRMSGVVEGRRDDPDGE